jgi:pseudouridine kinase
VATTPRVLVVGGAVLDQKLTTDGPPVLGTSNPGTAVAGVGGVGRNIAENLARLGTSTVLVAPVGDDLPGETVVGRTAAAGVDCRHVVVGPSPTGTYTAVLGDDGDLLVAVADMRATDRLTPADLGAFPDLVDGAAFLVVDANPSPDVVAWLLQEAALAGVPVVLEPVSVAKAGRLAAVVGTAPLHTVTPNADELGALLGGARPRSTDELVAAAAVLHDRGVGTVWVRRGAAGSLLSTRPVGGPQSVLAVAAPATSVVDVTGAGDAMTAGYVHALLTGRDVRDAARVGQVCAALTCASSDTVRTDLDADLVSAHLTPTDPSVEELR